MFPGWMELFHYFLGFFLPTHRHPGPSYVQLLGGVRFSLSGCKGVWGLVSLLYRSVDSRALPSECHATGEHLSNSDKM